MDVENRAEWRRRTRVADPHPRDLIQPEGERERESCSSVYKQDAIPVVASLTMTDMLLIVC